MWEFFDGFDWHVTSAVQATLWLMERCDAPRWLWVRVRKDGMEVLT